MSIDEMKAKIATAREGFEKSAGKVQMSSASGPIGIGFIENLLAIIEAQEARIKALEESQGRFS